MHASTSPPACYSLRLIKPFVSVLRESSAIPAETLDRIEALDGEGQRMPIAVVHDMLRLATEMTQDPDLGLKAGRRVELGDAGAMDYLWSTGATVRDALAAAATSTRLVNDALTVRLEESGELARILIESRVPVPRAATDFMVAALFQRHFRSWLQDGLDRTTVSFAHPEPESVLEYERTFAPVTPRFSQDFVGFTFERDQLDSRLPHSDPRLHQVMVQHAERLLAELPTVKTFTDRVRELILRELPTGSPLSSRIAKKLALGERTFARRLEAEGVTFKKLLDDSRRELAVRMVGSPDTELEEIARRLGFSQATAFYRAFRRWTGVTPMQHRAQRLRDLRVR